MDYSRGSQVENLTLDNLIAVIRALPQTSINWRGVEDISHFFEIRPSYIRVLCRPLSEHRNYELKGSKAYRCDIYPSGNDALGMAHMMVFCEGNGNDIPYRMHNSTEAINVLGNSLSPELYFHNKRIRAVEESKRLVPWLRTKRGDNADSEEEIEQYLGDEGVDYIKDYDHESGLLNYIKIELNPIIKRDRHGDEEKTERFIGIVPCMLTLSGAIKPPTVYLYSETDEMEFPMAGKGVQYNQKTKLESLILKYSSPHREFR
jgi:hypothetical protein